MITKAVITIPYFCSPNALPPNAESRMAGKRPTRLMKNHLAIKTKRANDQEFTCEETFEKDKLDRDIQSCEQLLG